mmetsp:Transcript_24607/g.57778  ORF Transcript_24607/g.57778 Transcript_24607/m.57778 type:complete len:128 (+) Transcript_24607:504-887(+)
MREGGGQDRGRPGYERRLLFRAPSPDQVRPGGRLLLQGRRMESRGIKHSTAATEGTNYLTIACTDFIGISCCNVPMYQRRGRKKSRLYSASIDEKRLIYSYIAGSLSQSTDGLLVMEKAQGSNHAGR